MTDDQQGGNLTITIPESQAPKLSDITALYVEAAEKMAAHTRVSTQELTKIIASMHQANQVG